NRPVPYLKTSVPVLGFLQRLGTDVIGPLLVKEGRKETPKKAVYPYILVVSDYLTKLAWAFPMKKVDAESTSQLIFERIICTVGAVDELLSDHGTNYDCALFDSLMKQAGITKTFSSPYSPQTNGLVERLNGTLVEMISSYVQSNPKQYHKFLP